MESAEQFLMQFKQSLLDADYDSEDVNKISMIYMLSMNNYDISRKETQIVVYGNDIEELLKMYAGCMLTEGRSPKTVKAYIYEIQRFYKDVQKPLLDVKTMDIRMYLARMQKRVSLASCENARSYLSAFYKWLTKEEIIEKDPTARIAPIKLPQNMKMDLNSVEIDKLREACKKLRERAELEFFLSCGARVSEGSAMNIQDIDFDTGEVFIREAKGSKQRIVYIDEVAKYHIRKYLESRKDDNPCLFYTQKGTRATKEVIEADFRRLGARANIEKVHPHRLRRCFGTHSLKRGMDIHTVQMLMGHADINTTTKYIALHDSYLRSEYNKYNV